LEYFRRLHEQEQLRRKLLKIMADCQLDAFVFPHQQGLVVKIGQTQVGRNGVLASVIGFPSITIPAGFSAPTTTAPLGVPIGIEFIGRTWSERHLLEIAAALEQARPVRLPPLL
jgi:amidase